MRDPAYGAPWPSHCTFAGRNVYLLYVGRQVRGERGVKMGAALLASESPSGIFSAPRG